MTIGNNIVGTDARGNTVEVVFTNTENSNSDDGGLILGFAPQGYLIAPGTNYQFVPGDVLIVIYHQTRSNLVDPITMRDFMELIGDDFSVLKGQDNLYFIGYKVLERSDLVDNYLILPVENNYPRMAHFIIFRGLDPDNPIISIQDNRTTSGSPYDLDTPDIAEPPVAILTGVIHATTTFLVSDAFTPPSGFTELIDLHLDFGGAAFAWKITEEAGTNVDIGDWTSTISGLNDDCADFVLLLRVAS